MDLEQLTAVVAELGPELTGARVAKIHQPSADLLVLRLWTGAANRKLLIAATAQDCRIHFTEQSFPNPFAPPRFCQLLRARIGRINGIRQLNADRIVELSCQGPKGECRLIVELTGRSSNLVLVDATGKIIDVLKRHPQIRNAPGKPYLFPEKKTPTQLKPSVTETELAAVSGSVEKLYSAEDDSAEPSDLRQRLLKVIAKEQKKLTGRLKKIAEEQSRQQGFEQYRRHGDLILANLRQIKKGQTAIVVSDYYQDPPEDITLILDTKLSPQDNAERCYHKYKKARRGLEHSARRIVETEDELAWLEDLEYQLQSAEQPADIVLIAEQLKGARLLKDKTSRLPRTSHAKTPLFKELTSPGGFKVLWGTNSRQNDYLSTRVLQKGDLWFHAHNYPGAHVVLKTVQGRAPFETADIEFAAALAAANSKAKHDSKVEVILAEAGSVKKTAGARPGMVTVQQYKTLMVKPFEGE